ncbi:MAG: sulfatase-like hydrolase/transferase [bacterium]|nr:sulfatase-like hydrolase/transferase [bacterium]
MKTGNQTKRVIVAALVIIAVVLYIILGPSSFKGKQVKNVILITIDTLRADYLSCYQNGTAQTPNLDRLADEGARFERCIAQTPLTLPSHTSILSGTYPLYHQVRDNGGLRVPPQLELVSEVLKREGFSTSAFIAAYVLHSKWGMNQGFDTYSDDFDLEKYKLTGTELEKRAEEVLTNAKQWISRHKKERFFTWVHLFDPHAEYEPPPPYDKKYPDNPYAGEVEYTDAQLGLFFQFLKEEGLYDDCLIIVTSDHGEGLWEHGERSHGFFVYDSTVRIPLIIRAADRFPGKRVTGLVESVDIAPTILDLLGIEVPKSYQGSSLVRAMSGKETGKQGVAYTEAYYSRLHLGYSELQSLYYQDWKYIRAPKEELYNMNEDAGEKNNTAMEPSASDKKDAVKRRLFKFIGDKSKGAIPPGQVANLSQRDRQRLESLGYLTTKASTGTQAGETLPDPKDKLEFFQTFDSARKLMSEEKFDEALQIAKKIVAEEPDNVDTLMMLGIAYSKSGSPGESIPYFEKILEAKPDYNDAMVNLLRTLNAVGEQERAIREGLKFLEIFPRDYVLLNYIGKAYFVKGEYDVALKHLVRSVEIEPLNSMALLRIGEIYLEKKDVSKAESYINRALGIYRDLQNAYYLLGKLEEGRGNVEQAREYYEKEVKNYPSNYIAAFHLAELFKKGGKYSRAIPYYRVALEGDPLFQLPYFMIANYYMEIGENLEEAIELCKKGIGITPPDQATLFGYFILTNIYGKLKDEGNLRYYTREGEKLYKALQEKK